MDPVRYSYSLLNSGTSKVCLDVPIVVSVSRYMDVC